MSLARPHDLVVLNRLRAQPSHRDAPTAGPSPTEQAGDQRLSRACLAAGSPSVGALATALVQADTP